jgi:DUF1680 family protein
VQRREFMGAMFLSGVASGQEPSGRTGLGAASAEQMATPTGDGYDVEFDANPDVPRWVQVDLGSVRRIDAVKLYPKFNTLPAIAANPQGHGFPVRFRIDVSEDPQFSSAANIVDQSNADFPDPVNRIQTFSSSGVMGRYVRLTANQLRQIPTPIVQHSAGAGGTPRYAFSLAKMDVLSDGKDIAEGRPISDSTKGELGLTPLTRAARPQGETTITDNPANVTAAQNWNSPARRIRIPRGGVRLDGGTLKSAFENNITYLLSSYSVDELLKEFRDRAGKPNPPNLPVPEPFWQVAVAGSNAGRFLMGAGNSLRWTDHPDLRNRMNQVVAGISECRQPNGYIMAYPEETIFQSERAAYARAWVTHGLIEAGYAGNADAFPLLRGFYDWYDRCPYLPRLLRGALQGAQGMIANTRMYHTPVGRPEDIQVVQRYFQENYWLAQLARRDEAAIWQYPYDRPHCYLITNIEAYLDLYLATGEERYLRAASGGWDLYRDKWEHVGGTIAICEGGVYPPGSYRLHAATGELCGSSFWSFLSQRFHVLYPDQEKYVTEIEKSLYNVALANQIGAEGIRYTASLNRGKAEAASQNPDTGRPYHRSNTCCEGQGTRLLSAIPEFIYSIAEDGLYVNLFEASTIVWKQANQTIQLQMKTGFPYRTDVELCISTAVPVRAVIRVRVPSWAASEMSIRVNNSVAAAGMPGGYVVLDRRWKEGDVISFGLPMDFRMTYYQGVDRVAGQERYALEYGPLLMALVGDVDEKGDARIALQPETLRNHLRAKAGRPLHFAIDTDPRHEYLPYWQVGIVPFTCFPVVGAWQRTAYIAS